MWYPFSMTLREFTFLIFKLLIITDAFPIEAIYARFAGLAHTSNRFCLQEL